MSFLAAALNARLDRYLELCSRCEAAKDSYSNFVVVTAGELRAMVNLVKDASVVASLGSNPNEAMNQLRTGLVNFLARADDVKEPT